MSTSMCFMNACLGSSVIRCLKAPSLTSFITLITLSHAWEYVLLVALHIKVFNFFSWEIFSEVRVQVSNTKALDYPRYQILNGRQQTLWKVIYRIVKWKLYTNKKNNGQQRIYLLLVRHESDDCTYFYTPNIFN